MAARCPTVEELDDARRWADEAPKGMRVKAMTGLREKMKLALRRYAKSQRKNGKAVRS